MSGEDSKPIFKHVLQANRTDHHCMAEYKVGWMVGRFQQNIRQTCST